MMSTDSNDVPYQLNYEEAVEICYFKGGKLFEPSNENILQPVSEVNEDYWSYVTLQINRHKNYKSIFEIGFDSCILSIVRP